MSIRYYGYLPHDWQRAKDEIRRILIQRAKSEHDEDVMISYSDLVGLLRTIRLEPDSYALAALLGEISREQDAAGHGMLTVIVVHKHDQQPGQGFFELAEELGRDVSDRPKCWIQEWNRVRTYWCGS